MVGDRFFEEPGPIHMHDEKLVDVLVCPIGLARLDHEGQFLKCKRCDIKFSIVDDIPNMLVDEATLPEGCNNLSELDCVRSGDAKLSLA